MHKPEYEQASERAMAAFFAADDGPADARFVAGVMNRIRRREQLRLSALGAGALLAVWATVSVIGVLEEAPIGVMLSVLDSVRAVAAQLDASRAALFQSLEQYAVFLAAASLAGTAVTVLGLLDD